jgi:hypothetical protein
MKSVLPTVDAAIPAAGRRSGRYCDGTPRELMSGDGRERLAELDYCPVWSGVGRWQVTAERSGSGSAVRRMLLGVRLRRLREAKRITREAAGYAIRASESKISRMELGRVGFKERDVSDLLALYGADQADRDELLEMARAANAPGWWQRYGDVLAPWFQNYLALEESASLIRTYEVQFVPGLLQTERYARAVFQRGHSEAPDRDVEQRIELRMARQERLLASETTALWAVIDEAALRRQIGGPEVMREQIEHLLRLAALPNITIQVMPLRFGGHPAEGGAFTLLRFPEPEIPDVVYVETLTGGNVLERPDEVDDYQSVMERLCVDSIPPDAIHETMNELLRRLGPPITTGQPIRLPLPADSVRMAARRVMTGGTRPEGAVLDVANTPFGMRFLLGKVVGDAPAGMANDVAHAFRDLAEHEPMLTGVAERMNATVAGSGHPEVFVTALLVTMRDWEDHAELVRCGHPPPLMLRGSRVSVVDAAPLYPPMGLLDAGSGWCETTTVPYVQGDRLLLHTQGAGEVRDAEGRAYPLAERAADLVHDDPETTLARLADDLVGYSAGPLKRGATFLLVQREAPAGVQRARESADDRTLRE